MKKLPKNLERRPPFEEGTQIYHTLIELRSTKEATERVVKILDSKYEKANLNEIVEGAKNLNKNQKQMLLKLLMQYKTLFNGTLGRLNTTPVNIEL